MSRAATSTPPPQTYFPQRNATPSMRHCAVPSVTAGYFANRPHHHGHGRRKTKNLPSTSHPLQKQTNASAPESTSSGGSADGLGLSFEDLGVPRTPQPHTAGSSPAVSRQTSYASFQPNPSVDSFQTVQSDLSSLSTDVSDADAEGLYRHDSRATDRSATPSASGSVSSVASRAPTQLLTPSSSDAAFQVIPPGAVDGKYVAQPGYPQVQAQGRPSWVGKVAMAVVNTGMSVGRGFGGSGAGGNGGQHQDKKAKKDLKDLGAGERGVSAPVVPQQRENWENREREYHRSQEQEQQMSQSVPAAAPAPMGMSVPQPQPTWEQMEGLSPEQRMTMQREWAEAEHRRVTECARLCSQWPQSGYNITKHGPKGANTFYQPQSFCNPQYVASAMQRQAEIEHNLCATSGMFFSCRHARNRAREAREREQSRESSDDETDRSPSVASYDESARSSPTASMILNGSAAAAAAAAKNDAKTEAELREAMASSLLSLRSHPDSSQVSLQLPASVSASPKSQHGARSLTELDILASSMVLSRDDSAMDVDETASVAGASDLGESTVSLGSAGRVVTRPGRAQSCGAKRPFASYTGEEEKRRKVDEAMVVEEAVETGVIMSKSDMARASASASTADKRMSSSVPDLGKATAATAAANAPPAVFGVVVKTSDTHPIIISPFFPAELLPVLAQHIVVPPPPGPFSRQRPLVLKSRIDVPSLLLSFVPPMPPAGQSPFPRESLGQAGPYSLGNMLLSSCPGKRLRMDGPSKGRGPVCRDLATDLRRIKNEGVGGLVCCLDDEELALLGVPWETYRDVAAETGLDVIRLPMPDGLTPASMALFDSQVTLIATKYTLQGTNVLVHCRGGIGRAGMTACAWAIKMGFVQPHPSLTIVEDAAIRHAQSQKQNRRTPLAPPAELEHQIVMSIVERVIAMIRCRRGLKAIESFEQVQFLTRYVAWLREEERRA
ncbi:hypothetical protein IAT38_007045 [Cryptococcus sp. DSM 104549]